jgi:hypothetical protein
MIITIVAFTDNKPNSVAYKKFTDIDKAVAFYRKQLEKEEVRVVSTRKVENEKT